MLRVCRRLAAIVLLAASCGGAGSTTTAVTSPPTTQPPTTQAPPPPTTMAATTTTSTTTTSSTAAIASTTTTAAAPTGAAPLRSYRFEIAVAVVADPGDPPGRPVYRLSGERTIDPAAMRIFGDFKGEDLELATDGSRWWDLDDLELGISGEDIQFFLGGNGFLLPEWMEALLAVDPDWQTIGSEELGGVMTQRARRVNIIGGVDWEFGDLAQLDVWRDDLGQLMKLQAWFATGDNTGFPVSIWQITERNPQVLIQLPTG